MKEITQMRIEMLGTAFTAQHSDARVLDQYVATFARKLPVLEPMFRPSNLLDAPFRSTSQINLQMGSLESHHRRGAEGRSGETMCIWVQTNTSRASTRRG